ncbi:MAG: serine/threonine protein phosphatase [Marinosulfonomonas sp.]|nr:serine/threonine protein phosphatase [Marinosulfonomonas sp.]
MSAVIGGIAMFSIRSFFARKSQAAMLVDRDGNAVAPLCPEIEVAVIGDIHGRSDLLTSLIKKLSIKHPNAHLVFVGDYVDRGPDSRGVLDRLEALGDRATCLMGNHEAMMLSFIQTPDTYGKRWFKNGGIETLRSFGIVVTDEPGEGEFQRLQAALKAELGREKLEWLQSLQLWWQSGNLVVTHAGPDPKASITVQKNDAFLWGHPRFLRDRRADDLWVAHGHWIQDRANARNARIAVDTGAFYSGRLSAAVIATDGTVRFITA